LGAKPPGFAPFFVSRRSLRRRPRIRPDSARHVIPVRSPRVAAVLIAFAAIVAFSNSFTGAFVFDDEPAIVENARIRQLTPLLHAMSAPAGTTVSGRPVAALSLAINYALAPQDARDTLREPLSRSPVADVDKYRRNVRGYHAFNLLVHIAAGLTLFGIVRRTLLSDSLRDRYGSQSTGFALAISLLWVVHPLTTASVTYVIQRVESLMGLFYLLTLYCGIRAWDRNPTWTVASVIACALGMATKESMVSAPLAIILWDRLFAPSSALRPSRNRWPLYGALAASWIVLALLVAGGHRPYAAGFHFETWPWWRYLITQAGVILQYLRLALVPWPLVLDYDWQPASIASAIVPVIVVTALVAATGWALVRRHPLAFPAAVFFLVLAPTSSVLPIVTEVAAEHRMYQPLACVITLTVFAVSAALNRAMAPPFARPVIVLAAVAALCGITLSRNREYQSAEQIWSDTVEKRPANARARTNYATVLLAEGRIAEAEQHLRRAVAIDPRRAEARLGLGVALAAQRRFDEGMPHLRAAFELAPDNPEVNRNLGEAYASQAAMADAVRHYDAALRARPDDVMLLNRLGWILATSTADALRDGARARTLAERAVQITQGLDAESLDTLAAAQAETGGFETAVATARRALDRARVSRPEMVAELKQRLGMYQIGQAFRQ
jgi:tetratricopeptide (TPR) repeat protein